MIRVVVVARTLAVRAGLRTLLDDEPGIRVLADAPVPEAVEAGHWDEADVVLLDGGSLAADVLTGLTAVAIPGVVALGGSGALRAALLGLGGPVGLLDSDVSSEHIHAAIAAVAAGLTVTGPGIVTPAGSQRVADDEFEAPELTVREREVLELVAAGLPNKGIASRLRISEHTVKFHLASVLAKLGAASRAEAVAQAARRGWIAL